MPTWTKEQQSAIETSGTNIIVSAGAGSGKTAVLSERVISKLSAGIHVDELLILTFTRAAAEEMKDRIRKKIKKNPNFIEESDRLESAYITTFDSFALSVLKKYHYLLNLPKDIEVTDESIIALKKIEIMDEIFDDEYSKSDPNFTKLIERFSLKNDKTLKEAILDLANKIENMGDKDNFLDYLENGFYKDENLKKLLDEFKNHIETKKHALSLELERSYCYFDEDYNSKLDSILLPIINSQNLEELISLKSAKLPALKRGSDEELKKIKDNIKTALDEVIALAEFGTEDEIIDGIKSTKATTLELIYLIKKYFESLLRYKAENNIYTFGDIARLSIEILKNFNEARNELKNKFKEIMIDEYQDTNDIQEEFISLIADHNVYMVGDIKQSIYRFRGSNPDIFKEKYNLYSKNDGGLKIDLIKNFRSREEVLENINRIFDLLMDEDLGGAAYTESHEMVYGNAAYDDERVSNFNYDMEVLEYDNPKGSEYKNTEVEIFTIAADIKNKLSSNFQVFDKDTGKMRPFRYSDAVIILDRSTYFDDFKKVFEYLNIPLTILKDDVLTSKTDIYIVKNLVDLLIHIKNGLFDSGFKYAFLSIGRSFLYEYTDEYLFDIITKKEYKTTTLYKDISSIEDYNSSSTRELITALLDKTEFYNKLYKIGDYKATTIRIENVLNMASSLGKLSYNIEDFRDYLTGIISIGLDIKYTPATVDQDSVQILTIHKSKGLEYPICYFADLDHNFNTRELKNRLIVDNKYGIISGIENEFDDDTDSILKHLYKDNFFMSEIGEKIRLFYVALTRAREHIVIVLPEADTWKLEKNRLGTIDTARRIKFRKLGDFIYAIKDYLPSYFKKIDLDTLGLTKDYLYQKTVNQKIDSREIPTFEVQNLDIVSKEKENRRFSKNDIELISKETLDNMKFGTKVHETLELIDFKNFNPNEVEDEFIRDKISRFLKNELFQNIESAKIYKEYEFVYEIDDTEYHGSIDLMLEYDGHIDIVDYKLKNTDDEHYKEQITGYKNYISQISNKPVDIYLYSIIDENLIKF